MKNLYIIYIITLCAFLCGCSDNYDESLGLTPSLKPRYLSVSTNNLTFLADDATKTFIVTSVQTPWKIENSVPWLTITPTKGEGNAIVSVSVVENTNANESRTGVFFFKSDSEGLEYTMPFSVTQGMAVPLITLSQDELEIKGIAYSGEVAVTTNCKWEASCYSDWLTVTAKEGALSLSASANTTDSHRRAIVYLTQKGSSYTLASLAVTQAPASITASSDPVVFGNTAGSATVDVDAEVAWTATTANSWIELSPQSGQAGKSALTINVSPNASANERAGYIVLAIGGKEKIQIPVRQRGIYVETKQSTLDYESTGGKLQLDVESNTSWKVTSCPQWLQLSQTEGQGNKSINVTASDNLSTTLRTGTIEIAQPGTSIVARVAVSQKGKTFDVNTTALNFNDKASSQTIEINAEGAWQAQTSANWITVSPQGGSGRKALNIAVTENNTESERTGTVRITMADKTITLAVVQAGKYFTIDNPQITFNSHGGQMHLSISTNDAWTATDDADWLSLSKTSGNGNVDLVLTATDNASVNSRTATVTLKTSYGKDVKLVVRQNARYLTVDTPELLFYAKGGTSEPITISTDAKYTITTSDSWLKINQTGNTFTVTTSENAGKDVRFGKITITMTDLNEGTYTLTLSVTQLNIGGTFLRKEYEEDINWDSSGSSSLNLVIHPFDNDKNFDNETASNGVTLNISSFAQDTNWDKTVSSGVTISVTGYNSDTNHDKVGGSNANISVGLFESDKNWNN